MSRARKVARDHSKHEISWEPSAPTERAAAFYADCQARYVPRSILAQALDAVPDTHHTMCGQCGRYFERVLGGPVDCLPCAANDDAAKIEELATEVASLEEDAESVEDAKAEAQKHYEARKDIEKRLDRAIGLLQRAQGLLFEIRVKAIDDLHDVAPLTSEIDNFMTEGGS